MMLNGKCKILLVLNLGIGNREEGSVNLGNEIQNEHLDLWVHYFNQWLHQILYRFDDVIYPDLWFYYGVSVFGPCGM